MLDQKVVEIHEANRIYLSTVEALATAVDARDQIGRGHVNRTQVYAVRMGEMLGLDKPEIEALNTAALLHDIGKLAVPDHILNKPGELTPAELEKVKTHAVVGASIASEIGFPYPVTPAIKHHHERWDGKGYPVGLEGAEIPLGARIIMVCDTIDAMTTARPYRDPLPMSVVRDELVKHRGSQFDPAIIDLVIANGLLEKIETSLPQNSVASPLNSQPRLDMVQRN
jgi:putative nucleotidyltransferase with HDIG domain